MYYIYMILIIAALLLAQTLTLLIFGTQYIATNDFWTENIDTRVTPVCILYAQESQDGVNPEFNDNWSCSFVFITIVVVMIFLIIWLFLHIVMEIQGYYPV